MELRMKLPVLVLGVLALLVVAPAQLAEADSPGAAPAATQHALDELANAIAQGKITLTPTPSPTSTPSPTATTAPTDTPVPLATATLVATPSPGLPAPAADADRETHSGWARHTG